jgi:membrane protease YdiL (CAAX protease family)
MEAFPSIADHILIWVFGIILPFMSGLQSQLLEGSLQFNEYTRKKLYLSNSLMLAIAGSSVLLLWFFKQRGLTTLGFNLPRLQNQYFTVFFLVAAFIIGYVIDLYFSARKMNALKQEDNWFEKSSFLPEKTRELPSYIILCLCAGIFEEIIYRGFMVTYFLPLNGTENEIPWMAIFAPSVLFSLAHTYQGWTAVIKIFIFSLLLGVIFIITKSIYPTMILHFLIDLVGGIVAMIQFNKKN